MPSICLWSCRLYMNYYYYPLEPIQPLDDDPDHPGKKLLRLPFSNVCGPITPPFRHPNDPTMIIQGNLATRHDYYHTPDAVPSVDSGSGYEIRYDLFDDVNNFRANLSQDWQYDALQVYASPGVPPNWSGIGLDWYGQTGNPVFDDYLTMYYQCPSGDWDYTFNLGQFDPQYARDKQQLTGQPPFNSYFYNAYGVGTVTPYNTKPAYAAYSSVVCDWIFSECTFSLIATTAIPRSFAGIIPIIAPLAMLAASMLTSAPLPARRPKK
jgi:hypothetical protein